MQVKGKRRVLSAKQVICVRHVQQHPQFAKGAFTVKQEQVYAYNVMLENIVQLDLVFNWGAWPVLIVQLSRLSVFHVLLAHIVQH